MLLLKKTLACNFTKFNTPQWVFSRFFTCTNGAIQMVQIVQMTEKIQNFNIMQKNWKYLLNRSRENDEKKKVFFCQPTWFSSPQFWHTRIFSRNLHPVVLITHDLLPPCKKNLIPKF